MFYLPRKMSPQSNIQVTKRLPFRHSILVIHRLRVSKSNSRRITRRLIFYGLIPAVRMIRRAVCVCVCVYVCKASTQHAAIRCILAGRSTASSTYRPLDEIERHVECSTSCKRLVEWSVGQYYLESSLTSYESFGPR